MITVIDPPSSEIGADGRRCHGEDGRADRAVSAYTDMKVREWDEYHAEVG